ncbi:MAG: DUF3047 domain-containing protein [Usitatibacter sp.]
MRRWALLAAAAIAPFAFAVESAIVPAFSAAPPGAALPAGWRTVSLPGRKAPEFTLVPDAGATVLQVHADAAAGSIAYRLGARSAAPGRVSWRWKVDHALARARFGTKSGDDFAARMYVTFDVPLDSLPFLTRTKIRLARLIYGADLPVAALCYVWDNREPVGTSAWNPYSDRVRMIVLESGNARAGQWVAESRDVEEDYRAAFGARAPAIDGIALSADTDQTGESVTAWFGDVRIDGPR